MNEPVFSPYLTSSIGLIALVLIGVWIGLILRFLWVRRNAIPQQFSPPPQHKGATQRYCERMDA